MRLCRILNLLSLVFIFLLVPLTGWADEPTLTPAVQARLEKFIHYHEDSPNSIGYIPIEDHSTAISESTWLYVKKALDRYKESKPAFIILELNTPGGEVFAAQKIAAALKEIDTQYGIPVVAYINNWAISAGAMLAYSCRFIAVAKDASMGAAEPVYASAEGKMETASEKINSALRADFANHAIFFDRNPLFAEAMVDKDMILVKRDGKVIRLDNEQQIRTAEPHPDVVISPKGKLLTLNAEQLMEFGVADILLLPEKLTPITADETSMGQWPADKMLLFKAPFFNKIPDATIDAYKMDWKTRFFVFLATPMVSSLLLMGLLMGAYIEFTSPGVSLPGIIAASCLFLILLSSFALDIANWLEVILILTGLVLILAELFVLPTFGFLGFVGILLFIGGLFAAMLPSIKNVSFDYDSNTFNAAGEYFIRRLASLCATLLATLGVIIVLGRYLFPSFSGFKRFVLAGNEQDASRGYVSFADLKDLPPTGSKGTVLATLRPAGKVIINNQIYDAISTGALIEAGEHIIVTGTDGNNLIVNRGTEAS